MRTFAVSFVLTIWVWVLVGCTPSLDDNQDNTISPYPSETVNVGIQDGSLPVFIKEMQPDKRDITLDSNNQAEVCIEPDFSQVVEPGDFLGSDVRKRVSLLIDGVPKEITGELSYPVLAKRVIDGQETYFPGSITYCWVIANRPGRYDATFQIEQASGNILLYSWVITVKKSH